MSENYLSRSALVVCFALLGPASAHSQGVVEYGTMTSGASGTAAAVSKVKPPLPQSILPPDSSTSLPPSVPTAARTPITISVENSQATAMTNRKHLEQQAGPEAAQLSVRIMPASAQVWIDSQFVGANVLDLKLSPGHHHLTLRAANMQDSEQDLDLTPHQEREITISLKSRYQNQVSIGWSKPQ